MENIHQKTVLGFGDEWKTFDQSHIADEKLNQIFSQYFSNFPLDKLDKEKSIGADFGCGSGRWSKFIAPMVKKLFAIDASPVALEVAKNNLKSFSNVEFINESIGALSLPENSLSFGFSLGVLHHIPDTRKALQNIYQTLQHGAPFLIYLYYSLDNQPYWYRILWKLSNLFRILISSLPVKLRRWITDLIAFIIYYPLARLSGMVEKLNLRTHSIPLSYYKDKTFYTMRNDALDRFGTGLEKRFSRTEIQNLLESCGFVDIQFSTTAPFWCAVCKKP